MTENRRSSLWSRVSSKKRSPQRSQRMHRDHGEKRKAIIGLPGYGALEIRQEQSIGIAPGAELGTKKQHFRFRQDIVLPE